MDIDANDIVVIFQSVAKISRKT